MAHAKRSYTYTKVIKWKQNKREYRHIWFEISSEDMKAIDSLDEGDDMSVTTPPLNTIYEEVR